MYSAKDTVLRAKDSTTKQDPNAVNSCGTSTNVVSLLPYSRATKKSMFPNKQKQQQQEPKQENASKYRMSCGAARRS